MSEFIKTSNTFTETLEAVEKQRNIYLQQIEATRELLTEKEKEIAELEATKHEDLKNKIKAITITNREIGELRNSLKHDEEALNGFLRDKFENELSDQVIAENQRQKQLLFDEYNKLAIEEIKKFKNKIEQLKEQRTQQWRELAPQIKENTQRVRDCMPKLLAEQVGQYDASKIFFWQQHADTLTHNPTDYTSSMLDFAETFKY